MARLPETNEECRLADEGDPEFLHPCPCGEGHMDFTRLRLGFQRWQCQTCGYNEEVPIWREFGRCCIAIQTCRPILRWRKGLYTVARLAWPELWLTVELFSVPLFALQLRAAPWRADVSVLGQRAYIEESWHVPLA